MGARVSISAQWSIIAAGVLLSPLFMLAMARIIGASLFSQVGGRPRFCSLLRARPEIIESTCDRVRYRFKPNFPTIYGSGDTISSPSGSVFSGRPVSR